ncbi:hypothetical protein BGX33_000177 [Mortierella sp. NVP41]|nr:hypothetical protein BGX33_000177 [Mortierella sp. NVP41]
MVAPLFRPLTIAAATGLVAGGAFTSYTAVYAEEYDRNERDYDRRHRHHDGHDDGYEDSHDRFRHSPEHHRFSNGHSFVANEEDLLPGLLYVALAGLSGSLVTRQRNILFRMFSPLAFAAAAGAYVLPKTTHSIIDSIGGPMSDTCAQHPSGFSKPGWTAPTASLTSSSSPLTDSIGEKVRGGKGELSSRAHEAWHQAESTADSARDSVDEGAQRAKHWSNRHSQDATDAVGDVRDSARQRIKGAQDQIDYHLQDHQGRHRRSVSDSGSNWFHYSNDADRASDEIEGKARKARHWWSSKSSEAEDAIDEAKGRAREAQRDARNWRDEKYSEAEGNLREVESKAESKLHEVEGNVKDASKDAKHWWNKHSSEAEDKLHEAEVKAKETTKEVKHWWNKHSSEAEDKLHEAEAMAKDATKKSADTLSSLKDKSKDVSKQASEKLHDVEAMAKDVSKKAADKVGELKDKSKDVKNWVEEKAHEAEKVAEDVAHKAKDLVDSTTASIDKKIEDSAKEADEWWKIHAAAEEKKNKERLSRERREAEEAWHLHHSGAYKGPEHADHHEHKRWWSSRTRSAVGPDFDSADKWSSGEEMGSAKMHEYDFDYRYRNPGPFHNTTSKSTYTSSDSYMDGLLDNKDVNHWSSTDEEIGSSRLEGSSPIVHHTYGSTTGDDFALYGFRPKEPEYWSNGEEMSSANVRDSTYYNYPGSFAGSSLGRTSWWSRRADIDHDSEMNSLMDKAESLVWETKRAAERASLDIAAKLAAEQAKLEKSAAIARARAEEAARLAKAHSDALIRDRQAAIDRAAKEMEVRFAQEKEAADRAAAETKAKAHAWELEQHQWAEQSAMEVQDRVLREKIAAEEAAVRLKARADDWAREQKEKADIAAREIHDRVVYQTAAAEKAAREAKAALELKAQQEKLKVEQTAREIQERLRLEKIKEEDAQAAIRARAEALAQEEKIKVEKVARELEEKLSLERAKKAAEEAKIRSEAAARDARARAEALLAESRRASEIKSSSSSSGWSWPWSSSKSHGTEVLTEKVTTSTTSKAKHSHDEGFDSTGQLLEHIVEDIKQTKEDIQDGLGHLKETVFGAETAAAQDVKAKVEKTAKDTQGWWSKRPKDTERKLQGLESEFQSGLDKAGGKLREMGQEATESDAEFWQKRQQQERRESGRAM